jgi:peptidoglycan/LPS O-acetylase OafA/YrhL
MTELLTKRPQIDGLRALAMLGVLYVHFWNDMPVTENVRVTLFLVISGFLITHILMNAKARGGHIVVRNFYIRRALRLFPALMVCFAVAWAFNADGFRASAAWHFMPTSNIYFAINKQMHPWVMGHLWSLNVLEQFYLAWPLVVLFLSEKTLHVVVVLGLAALIFVHTNASHLGIDGWWRFMLLSSDPILMGALAYLLQRHKPVRQVMTSPFAIALSLIVLASPLVLWAGFGHSSSYRIFAQPAVAILVVGAFQGYRGPIEWLLQSPPAQFLAMISYGVYVYHLMVWYVVVQVYPPLFTKGPLIFAVLSAVTIAVATVSWYVMEEPIGRLKDAFPVRRGQPKAAGEGAPVAEPVAPVPVSVPISTS